MREYGDDDKLGDTSDLGDTCDTDVTGDCEPVGNRMERGECDLVLGITLHSLTPGLGHSLVPGRLDACVAVGKLMGIIGMMNE